MGDGRFGLGATCLGLAGPHPGMQRALQPRDPVLWVADPGSGLRERQELPRWHSVVEAGLGPGLLQAFVHAVVVIPNCVPHYMLGSRLKQLQNAEFLPWGLHCV